MRTSYFACASLGSIFLHVMIAYALFMGSMTIPKPAIKEFMVTHVSFLDELKPSVPLEEIKHEVPVAPTPIAEKKLEKKVKKKSVKNVPIQKTISAPILAQAPSSDLAVEKTVQIPTVSKEQEKASASSLPQSNDLLSLYLSKVRHKIQASLHYPSMAKKMGLEGEAVIQFLIHSNGMVDASSIKIAKSSGKALLDRNAKDAILDALPFELPPKKDLEIVIPVVFKLKS